MRHTLQRHRWITLLVTGLLLFGTSGLALSRMTCPISGHSVVSVGSSLDCCPEVPAGGTMVLPECCAIAEAQGAQVIGVVALTLELDATLIPMGYERTDSEPLASGNARPTYLECRPPPLATLQRLAVIGQFLI